MFIFGNPLFLLGLILIPLLYIWHRRYSSVHEGTFQISSKKLFSKRMKFKGRIIAKSLLLVQYLTIEA